MVRAAGRHDRDQVVIFEGARDDQNRVDGEDGLDQGEGDALELLPLGRAVDLGRFKELRVDVAHGGELDDHMVADILPHDHDDDHDDGDVLVGEPDLCQASQADELEECVEQAVIAVINESPGQTDSHTTDDAGQEKYGLEEGRASDLFEDRVAEEHGQGHVRDQGTDHHDDVVAQGLEEGAIVEQVDVILQADEGIDVHQVGVKEGKVNIVDDGDQRKGCVDQQRGKDKDRDALFVAHYFFHRMPSMDGRVETKRRFPVAPFRVKRGTVPSFQPAL